MQDEEPTMLEHTAALAGWLAVCLAAVLTALVVYRVWPR